MQLELFSEGNKKRTIEYIPVEKLTISKFNYRKTRNKADIEKLAQRIQRNGFEITRAVWAYRNNGNYEVFAGGNRLEAAKLAVVKEVPTVIYDGIDEGEIARLALEDNENDEYHTPVNMVDVWAHYAAVYELMGTETKTADKLGVSQQLVNFRLRLNELPDWLKEITTKNDFEERKMREFLRLLPGSNWITQDEAYHHIVKKILYKSNPTAKYIAAEVDALNETIKKADETISGFGKVTFYQYHTEPPTPYEWDAQAAIIGLLKDREVRTTDGVISAQHEVNERIAKEAQRYAEYTQAQEEATKPIEVSAGDCWSLGDHLLYCGDTSSKEFHSKIEKVDFAFADPPYNANAAEWDNDFRWLHDYLLDKAPIVAVTPGISSIFGFAKTTTMNYSWSMSCYINNGMTRGALGFGNWIYIALFSNESIHKNAKDFIEVSVDTSKNSEVKHKGKKPLDMMKKLISMFTDKEGIVLDPFLGSGTTLFACEELGRVCIGGEIEPEYCKQIIEAWQNKTGKKAVKHG